MSVPPARGISTAGSRDRIRRIQEYEDKNRILLPLYSLEYGDGGKGTFTVESAREGIGDRNLLDTEDADETQIESLFGPMYLIYTPKGKTGHKDGDQGELGERCQHEGGESEGRDGASGPGAIPRVFGDRNYRGRIHPDRRPALHPINERSP